MLWHSVPKLTCHITTLNFVWEESINKLKNQPNKQNDRDILCYYHQTRSLCLAVHQTGYVRTAMLSHGHRKCREGKGFS